MSRRPFDLFEVEKVGEYPDNHGGTFCEPITSETDQAFADEEAVRQFWTAYGFRSRGDGTIPSVMAEDGGAFAIFDSDDEQFVIDLAYALADGKPVYIRGTEVPNV